jgi:hypothetical protein
MAPSLYIAIHFYLWVTVVVNSLLFIIWKNSNRLNFFIKVTLFGLTIFGIILMMKNGLFF